MGKSNDGHLDTNKKGSYRKEKIDRKALPRNPTPEEAQIAQWLLLLFFVWRWVITDLFGMSIDSIL